MSNSENDTLKNAILYGWRTRNVSLYYGFPIVMPDDINNLYVGQTRGRLDLVPDHLLWSNLTNTQRDDMNNLLGIIRAWWEFPRWISTILFCGVLFLANILAPENDQSFFIMFCLFGGIIVLLTTIIESIIVTSYYIKFLALNFPMVTMLISWILLVVCNVTALLNSFFVSILISLGWIVIVYFITLFTRIIVWRIRRSQSLS